MTNTKVTINSRKYDGSIHRSWDAELIERKDSLIVLKGVFKKTIEHEHLNVIRRGTLSYEYFWLDRWYNVFRFHEPEGDFRNFYCNIAMPPKFEDGVLDFADLDVDILVSQDLEIEILDQDELGINAQKYAYNEEILGKVEKTVEAVTGLIEKRDFPFDFPV